eukprot:CAMPEP_0115869814 /NCGR_PEP_ID=MMETSP0287-20121206/22002_1 /TAXON_ID=412157 /ORGANISM="Chrysochromulina rotalis, Strain UIO044" /LENGTH=65 /DNA_ID=CAMNT_0003324511 /DNA_START=864 /DNA_END=1061 /DNA_ORIENTATION=-
MMLLHGNPAAGGDRVVLNTPHRKLMPFAVQQLPCIHIGLSCSLKHPIMDGREQQSQLMIQEDGEP